jgi:hypothetical protein
MRKARRLACVVATLVAFAACGADTPRPAPPTIASAPASTTTGDAPPAPPPPRDDGRLPATVTPLKYALAIDVDPSRRGSQAKRRSTFD